VEAEAKFQAGKVNNSSSSVSVVSDPELYELMSSSDPGNYFDGNADVLQCVTHNTKLQGPSQVASLTARVYMQLRSWCIANAPDVSLEVTPHILKLAYCVLANGQVVRSLEMLRSNATRSASLIQHLYDAGDGKLK